MGKKRKGVEIRLICPKCGKKQLRDESKSTESWNIFTCGEKCPDCDVEYRLDVK